MSPLAKVSLLVSGFSLIVMASARFVLGMWHPLLYIFLAVFLIGLVVSVVLDYKLYLDFLSIKTAQKGLSLGWSLLIVIVFLVAFSYLGNRFNKSWDLTQEGINSLSEQSLSSVKDLDSELVFYIFYKGDKTTQEAEVFKQELKTDLALYKQANSKIKTVFVNAYKNPLSAEEYLSDLPDKDQQELFVFVNYKNRKIRVSLPFSEEDLTSAIIKSKKRGFKEILFLTGHGEKDLNDSQPGGLKILNQALADSGFILKEWSFVQQGEPDKNVSVIASIGPKQKFLTAEKNWLKEYLSKGGSLILALDPKEKHNLEDFLKEYGLLFNNDFILSQLGLIYGSPTRALGVVFDKSNPITKKLSSKQTVLFETASSLSAEPSAFEKFNLSYLVKTHNQSFTANELKRNMEIGQLKSVNMALESSKKESGDKDKAFKLVLFGDSDFLSNRYIYDGANRDFALNSFVSLAGEEDLVSIRPKQPKGTKIKLNRSQKMGLILAYILLPLLFLMMSLWLWYKRRNA